MIDLKSVRMLRTSKTKAALHLHNSGSLFRMLPLSATDGGKLVFESPRMPKAKGMFDGVLLQQIIQHIV
jgi:hypothetical protein